MSATVFFALKNAVDAARSDAGNSEWCPMGNSLLNLVIITIYVLKLYFGNLITDGPATIDKLHKMMLTDSAQFTF